MIIESFGRSITTLKNRCILTLATVSLSFMSFQQQLFQIQVYTTTDKAVQMVLELCIQSYGQYVEKHLVHTSLWPPYKSIHMPDITIIQLGTNSLMEA